MQIKTLQWNIGGGFIRKEGDDVMQSGVYAHEDLSHVIDLLGREQPDIITFQESHATPDQIQAAHIANELGYNFWINDSYGDSHIDTSAKLCLSVISRFPIGSHRFEFFLNPHWTRTDGTHTYLSRDTGMTTCELHVEDTTLTVQTLHALPFNNFYTVDPRSSEALPVLSGMDSLMLPDPTQPYLLQGDFNIDQAELLELFPLLAERGVLEFELNAPTTPKGRHFDHVLYRHLTPVSICADASVLTDHYPIIATFDLI